MQHDLGAVDLIHVDAPLAFSKAKRYLALIVLWVSFLTVQC